MWALTVFAIYLIPFFAIGVLGKRLADRWIDRKGLDMSGVEMGAKGGKRRLFLLGAWRTEGDS